MEEGGEREGGEDGRRRVFVGGGGAEIGGRGEGRPGSIKPFIRNIEAWVLGFVMMIEPAHPPSPPKPTQTSLGMSFLFFYIFISHKLIFIKLKTMKINSVILEWWQ